MRPADNYPDDIRSYDKDPRSPFYVAPPAECKQCGKGFNSEDSHDSKYTDEPLCSFKCVDDFEEEYINDNSCEDCGKLECECE